MVATLGLIGLYVSLFSVGVLASGPRPEDRTDIFGHRH